MEFLADLWFPILLSAVFVFIASSVFHMVVPWHKSDCKKLPNEADLLLAIRAQGVRPGMYMFPAPNSMKEMCSPEMLGKFRQGPVGSMIIRPNGAPNMGKHLTQWFVFCLLVGLFVAYATWHALPAGAPYREVFRLAGTAAILGYACTHIVESIWKGQSWAITAKFVFDGVVYGLVTAGTFGWLWPSAGV